MTQPLRVELKMTPVPKGRPRMARNGCVYTPRETREAEAFIFAQVSRLWHQPPYEGPVSIEMTFWMPKPRRCPRKLPTVKPDLDNLVKLIWDSVQNLVIKDDSQVVHMVASKNYVAGGGEPGVSMTVNFWGDDA